MIDPNWANSTLSDIAVNGLSLCLLRNGSSPMSGTLLLTDGTVSIPGLGFNSEPSTGIYRAGTGELAFTVTGVTVYEATTTTTTIATALAIGNASSITSQSAIQVLTLNSAASTGGSVRIVDNSASGQLWDVGSGLSAGAGIFEIRDSTRVADVLSASTTGNVVIPGASSSTTGVGLTVNGSGVTQVNSTLAASCGSEGFIATFSDGTNITGYIGFDGGHNLQIGSTSAAYGVQLVGGNRSALQVANTGGVTINAPTGGVALAVDAANTVPGIGIFGSSGNIATLSLCGNGAAIGGTDSYLQSSTNSDLILGVRSANNLIFQTDAITRTEVTGGGNQTMFAPTSGTTLFVNAVSGATALRFEDEAGNSQDAGYRGLPQNSQAGSYSTVLADRGKHIYMSSGSAKTLTVPASTYNLGDTITIFNFGAGVTTIVCTTASVYWSPTGTTGNRSLAQYGLATLMCFGANEWVITGTGLT